MHRLEPSRAGEPSAELIENARTAREPAGLLRSEGFAMVKGILVVVALCRDGAMKDSERPGREVGSPA